MNIELEKELATLGYRRDVWRSVLAEHRIAEAETGTVKIGISLNIATAPDNTKVCLISEVDEFALGELKRYASFEEPMDIYTWDRAAVEAVLSIWNHTGHVSVHQLHRTLH